MSKRAFSEIREVKIKFNNTAGAMSLDAYKAAIEKVQQIESNYASDATLANLAAAPLVFTGTSRYKLYSFTLTTTLATGIYAFVYVETVPNADSLS